MPRLSRLYHIGDSEPDTVSDAEPDHALANNIRADHTAPDHGSSVDCAANDTRSIDEANVETNTIADHATDCTSDNDADNGTDTKTHCDQCHR